MDVMLRSCGYEPEQLNNREKWLLLARMLPLVENNFNLCAVSYTHLMVTIRMLLIGLTTARK